jgi:hypothetical protein
VKTFGRLSYLKVKKVARLIKNSFNNTGRGFPTVQLQIIKKVAGSTQNHEKTIGTPNQPIRTKIFLKA